MENNKLIDIIDETTIEAYMRGIIDLTKKLPPYIRNNIVQLRLSPLQSTGALTLQDVELNDCKLEIIKTENVITRKQTKPINIRNNELLLESYHVVPKGGK